MAKVPISLGTIKCFADVQLLAFAVVFVAEALQQCMLFEHWFSTVKTMSILNTTVYLETKKQMVI